MNIMRRCILAVAVLGMTTPGGAQVLHEHVEVSAVRCANGVCWRAGRASDGAAAILSDGEVVPAPTGGPQPQAGEPIYSPTAVQPSAAAGDEAPPPGVPINASPSRRPSVRMDRETGPEPPGTRNYHEPFNPAIFPFKRMSALDGVRPDETLGLAPGHEQLGLMAILGADKREPGRDAFWGSIVVDFEPGVWVPIPSVAANARVLAYRTEPSAAVDFAHDGADNYFARSSTGGRHRLTWLTDAPQSYFSGDLPVVRISDEPRNLLVAVPPAILRRAQRVWVRIGVKPERSALLNPVLDALVEWFRAFEPGDPPPATGSTYLDLALAQKGSCRHRSYAFVITALAAGIPARYVENELHVFVEVYVPQVGWRRINLGGALVDHEVSGANGKVPYKIKGADPFPEPPQFARGNDAVPPPPRGLKERGASGGRSGNGASSGGSGIGGSGSGGDGSGVGAAGRGIASYSSDGHGARVDLDSMDAASGSGAPATGAATAIRLEVTTRAAFRGERVAVAGKITSADGNAGNLPVEIYLDGPGGALRVGSAVTDGDGSWHAEIEVPRDLEVGDHRVVARTPGDGTRRPATSRARR
jgi:hypothetical protein